MLSEQFVEEAVELVLTRLIPLSTPDLERWTDDPEEWVNQEEKEGDAWEFDLRVCAIPFYCCSSSLMSTVSLVESEF